MLNYPYRPCSIVHHVRKGGRKMKKGSMLPKHYVTVMSKHPKLDKALEALGKAVREEGPLDEKTAQLIQLAGAACIHSEGSVHSHARRALAAGATPEEVRHTLFLLVTTIGFPTVMAALSWVDDVSKKKK
jgi:alkylhydroperoxidase/carboxymuconolactone decarboxylase family protein YurZ